MLADEQDTIVLDQSYRTRAYETGPSRGVEITSIANYLQEIAGDHAMILNFSEHRLYAEKKAWVLSRMRVNLDRTAGVRERVNVQTWPANLDKYSVYRDFVIRDENEDVMGLATSMWVIIDLEQRKMVPIPDYVKEEYPNNWPERVCQFEGRAIPKIRQHEVERSYIVRPADIDLNNHVNNVHYMEWVWGGTPREWRDEHRAVEMDISFRSECKEDDVLLARCAFHVNEEGRTLHSIVKEDGSEAVRAQMRWVKR